MNRLCAIIVALVMTLGGTSSFARTVDLGTTGSEIPEEFSPVTDHFKHARQEVMIAWCMACSTRRTSTGRS